MHSIPPVKTAGIPVLLKVRDAVNDAFFGGIASIIVWSFYRLTSADAALMAKYNNGEITKEECDHALSHKY